MPHPSTISEAVDRLLVAFRERWPGFELDDRADLVRALHRADICDIEAVVFEAVALDDRPPTAAVLARRVALERTERCRPHASGQRPAWVPNPAVLDIIRESRDRMAAAGDRMRL